MKYRNYLFVKFPGKRNICNVQIIIQRVVKVVAMVCCDEIISIFKDNEFDINIVKNKYSSNRRYY